MTRILRGLLCGLLALSGTAWAQVTYFPPTGVPGLSSSGTTITSTVPLLLPNGSAAAPSLGFATTPTIGMHYISTSAYCVFDYGSGCNMSMSGSTSSGLTLGYSLPLSFGSGQGTPGSGDVFLYRDGAANTLALRNSTASQTFNLYKTYSDANNYVKLSMFETGGVFYIQADGLGTGSGLGYLALASENQLYFQSQNVTRWAVDATTLYPATDDTHSLGTGSFRATHGYFSRSLQGSKSKALTDAAAAVSFVRIAVPTNGYIGGELIYTANSTNGTDRLTTTNTCRFAGADTAGTVTCGAVTCDATPATAYRRANTLVCTVSAATSTTNCDLQVTCTDNLAGDQTPTFEWRLDMPSPATVTPQ